MLILGYLTHGARLLLSAFTLWGSSTGNPGRFPDTRFKVDNRSFGITSSFYAAQRGLGEGRASQDLYITQGRVYAGRHRQARFSRDKALEQEQFTRVVQCTKGAKLKLCLGH